MDPFQRSFQALEGNKWGDYNDDSEEESQHYSSDDDIGEIEEALLQTIHYAEDCQDDGTPFLYHTDPSAVDGSGERGSVIQVYDGRSFPNVTIKSLGRADTAAEQTEIVDERKDGGGTSEDTREDCVVLNSDRAMEISKPVAIIPKVNSTVLRDLTKKRKKKLRKKVVENEESSLTRRDAASDSDNESKYKLIRSRKVSRKVPGKVSGNSCDPEVIIISDSSSEDGDSSRNLIQTSKTSLENLNVDIVSIHSGDNDSDSGSPSHLEINSRRESQRPQADGHVEASQPSTKRSWKKPKGSDDTELAGTSKKLRIKRPIVDSELRKVLDTIKAALSGDDSSDPMLIESHSEDEALDVHYKSNPTPRRAYYQSLSYERGRSRGRYYQEPEGWPKYKCYNCLEFGHVTKDCPKSRQRKVTTCVLCSTQGHNDRQCPDALCYICSTPGHQARECPNKKMQYLTCRRCSVKGHTEKLCPDKWRQYHLTTEPGKIICDTSAVNGSRLVAENGKVFCYNCSKEGHFGHECLEEPMDRHTPLILPYVVKYDYIPRRFWRLQMDAPEPRTEMPQDQVPNQQGEIIAPSTVTTKPRRTAKKRLVPEARAVLATTNAEAVRMVPPNVQKQGRKAKRKREQAADDDQIKKKVKKKIRQDSPVGTTKELVIKEWSALPKKERQRMKREKRKRHRAEPLDRAAALDDTQDTDPHAQAGGQALRKGEEIARETFTPDVAMPQPGHEVGKAKTKTKTKKKARWPKGKRRELEKQRQQTLQEEMRQLQPLILKRRSSPGEQLVSFRPDFSQFAELETKFQAQHRDLRWEGDMARQPQEAGCIRQGSGARVDPSQGLVGKEASAGSGKRKRKKTKLKIRERKQESVRQNVHHKVLTGKGPGITPQLGAMSRKQLKKQEARQFRNRPMDSSNEQRNSQRKQKIADRQLVSNRGFRIGSQYPR